MATNKEQLRAEIENLDHNLETRLAFFHDFIFEHPLLVEASEKLNLSLENPSGAPIILVVGPSGVGKTTLLQRTYVKLVEKIKADVNPNDIPYLRAEVPAYEGGNLNWKDFHTRILDAADEPQMEHKLKYDPHGITRDDQGRRWLNRANTIADFRREVEKTLAERKVKAVLLDEGQHLAKLASGRSFKDQMDTLKSFTNITGTKYVLFGTYELLAFTELSAQLDRRTEIIHFPRYDIIQDAKHRKAFKRILVALQHQLPVLDKPDLTSKLEWLYEGSIGLVGLLKDWITTALYDSLHEGNDSLRWEHIEAEQISTGRLVVRLRELMEGENRLKDDSDIKKLLLRSMLKLSSDTNNEDRDRDNPPESTPQKMPRPGERLPKRDLVGKQ